jgi:site-specific recombinase XerD
MAVTVQEARRSLPVASPAPDQAAWEAAVGAYLSGKTPHTARAYLYALRGFFEMIPGRLPGSVTVTDLASYRLALEARGSSPATVRARLAALSSFFAFASTPQDAAGHSLCACNPVRGIGRPRTAAYGNPRKTPRAAVTAILAQLDAGPADPQAHRDRALITTMVLTGRRRAEIAALCAGDLEADGSGGFRYRYRGKGGKVGLRELPQPAAEALAAYLAATGRAGAALEADPKAPLFLSLAGRTRGRALCPDGIARILKRRAREAGLDPATVKAHGLRHVAAETRRSAGASVEEIQSFLDHSSLATTATYLRRTEGTTDAGWKAAWGILRPAPPAEMTTAKAIA